MLVRTRKCYREEQIAKRYGLDPKAVHHVIYVEGECMRALECGDLSWGAYRDASLKRLSRMGARLEDDAPKYIERIWREHLQEPIPQVTRLWMGMRPHISIVSASNIDAQSYACGVVPHPMVANLFHHHTHSFQLGRRKGDKDYFQKLRKQLGAAPEECFFVDDLAEHVQAAQDNGIAAFHLDRVDMATLCELKAHLVEAGIPDDWVAGGNESILHC